jgi:hypothetical protein
MSAADFMVVMHASWFVWTLAVIWRQAKELGEAKNQLAATKAVLARVRADRDDADAQCAAVEAPAARPLSATDQTGRPFALATWQTESKPS